MDKSKQGKSETQVPHTEAPSEGKVGGPSAGHNPTAGEAAGRGAGGLQPGQTTSTPPQAPQQSAGAGVVPPAPQQPPGPQPQQQGGQPPQQPQPPKPDTLTGRAQRMGLAPDWHGPLVSQLGPVAAGCVVTLVEKLVEAQGKAESQGKGVAHTHPQGEKLPGDLQQKIDELASATMEHVHGGK